MQPAFIAPLRSLFEKQSINTLNMGYFEPLTYESQLPYVMKFMIDKNIVGMGWLRLKAKGFKECVNRLSSC